MHTPETDLLQQLARAYGVVDAYTDIWGKEHPTPAQTQRAILAAMGLRVGTGAGLREELHSRPQTAPPAEVTALLAETPDRGYLPPAVQAGARVWGINVALYGVRSARNWGVGDFADLAQIAEWAAELGADFVGLLPLHHLFNSPPYSISPYFPSSRVFLNPLYIAVDQLPEACAPAVRDLVEGRDVQRRLAAARGAEQVAYADVWQVKWEVLAAAYQEFRHREARSAEFAAWRERQGAALEQFATFCTLRDHHLDPDGHPLPWNRWPAEHRRPDHPAIETFRQNHRGQIAFHAWLQWLAEEQLAAAQRRCQEGGMAIGLYLDTALGVDPCGADAWLYQDVLALDASAGAPPDPFSLLGQSWGVPPVIPERHRATGYRFLKDSLGRNAARAGALRIDHVLAFWRLFWVPDGLQPTEGAYVRDRPEELLAVTRQVSCSNRCLIVGEDLGTVPPGVREDLRDSGFFSYRVMIFEKDDDGFFRPPDDYPEQSLVSVATHDLPTLDGFWLGSDLEVKVELDRYPSEESREHDAEVRRWDRFRLMEAMEEQSVLPAGIQPAQQVLPHQLDELAVAVHAFLARTPAGLMLVNADDLLGETEMQNLPGTLTEHPNWQRKGRHPLEEWGSLERPRKVAAAICSEGRGRPPSTSRG